MGGGLRGLSVPSVEPVNLVNQTCLPVMLAYSGALQGSIGKQEEWWIRSGEDKKPNVHMQQCSSACGVRHHRYGRSR